MDAQMVHSSFPWLVNSITGFDTSEINPLESIPIAILTRQMRLTFEQMGFNGFLYYGVLDEMPESAQETLYLPQWKNEHRFIGTMGVNTLIQYHRETGGDRRIRERIFSAQQLFQREPLDHRIPQQRKVLDFFTALDVHSQLFVPVHGLTGRGWHCQFMLNSGLSDLELASWLKDHQVSLLNACFYFHTLLMRDYSYLFNPWLINEMISDRALDVLTLTANGLGSKEIAGKINLSEKGVNYHLNHLREVLGADNRVHLVAVAKDMRII
ncbi:helix-turn-helix transcriptional regulator [Endozoicomonas atrinae]|uniref:helix-turn-helix transcriptional regulator n=1 Tax=Endozoicomonas atrinae TaxID=1333660 RepID=UPI00082547EA|nr:helix-turn-helix transcriptional regulator [Endozoicomonas atrinae]